VITLVPIIHLLSLFETQGHSACSAVRTTRCVAKRAEGVRLIGRYECATAASPVPWTTFPERGPVIPRSRAGLHYAPILNQRIRREMPPPNRPWRVDETFGGWSPEFDCGIRGHEHHSQRSDPLVAKRRSCRQQRFVERIFGIAPEIYWARDGDTGQLSTPFCDTTQVSICSNKRPVCPAKLSYAVPAALTTAACTP
jgi:hypothetical protein